jgi:hypothetical protein
MLWWSLASPALQKCFAALMDDNRARTFGGAHQMSRPWSPNEPARQPDYRRMYNEVRKLYDRIASQDQCITFLLVELRAAQKRIEKLETWRARTVTENATLDEQVSRLDQCSSL